MIWTSRDWQADAKEADFVIFDQNGRGEMADELRRRGVKVWNGGVAADRLEKDRSFAMKVCRKLGIPIPDTFDFHGAKDALEILAANFSASDRAVIKMDDEAGCSTSYVAKDIEDLRAQIEAWEKSGAVNLEQGGIIQRFVEGTEFSVEGWFDGERFLYPSNWTMEDKKVLNDNLGPNVGCAFTVTRNIRPREPRVVRKFLVPLAPFLKKAGFVGQIDVNTIVTDEGDEYALEFTPRPGYDATSTLIQGLPGYGESVARALGIVPGDDLIAGADRPFDFFASVRVWIPPYPFEAPSKTLGHDVYTCTEGVPVNGLPLVDRFVPYDVRVNDENETVMAGTCGVAGIGLGRGSSVEEAIRHAYSSVKGLEIPNLCYRTDGGKRVLKQYPQIVAMGLLR
jgi:phosphoribosylamine-glycine ligase